MIREKVMGGWLAVAGAIGLAASFVLMVEKLHLLENPSWTPPCDIGAILSCSSVMKSEESHAFGFANPILGLIGFPVVMFFGVLVLSRVRLPEWLWAGLNAGALLGLAFVHWLAYGAVFTIHFLCPWCMLCWAVVIPLALYVTRRNAVTWWPESRFAGLLYGWHAVILGLWLMGFATVIGLNFF